MRSVEWKSVKCKVSSVEYQAWGEKCKCKVWSVQWKVWSVEGRVESVECKV